MRLKFFSKLALVVVAAALAAPLLAATQASASDSPAITVTLAGGAPVGLSTGLSGADVQVSGTNFPSGRVAVLECLTVGGCDLTHIALVSGPTFNVPSFHVNVQIPVGNTVGDCRDPQHLGCVILAVLLDASGHPTTTTARFPLWFQSTSPIQPTIQVLPQTSGLVSPSTLSVSGSGFYAGLVFVAECQTLLSSPLESPCDTANRSFSELWRAAADGAGNFAPVSLTVSDSFTIGGSSFDCKHPAPGYGTCFVVASQDKNTFGYQPISFDTTAPVVALTTPPDGAIYAQGASVPADFSCVDEPGGSGLASCVGTVPNGAAIETSTLGGHSFTVTGTDNAGNTASVTHHYTIMKVAATRDDCKDDGWQQVVDDNFQSFKNQGDCVSFVATGGKNPANG